MSGLFALTMGQYCLHIVAEVCSHIAALLYALEYMLHMAIYQNNIICRHPGTGKGCSNVARPQRYIRSHPAEYCQIFLLLLVIKYLETTTCIIALK